MSGPMCGGFTSSSSAPAEHQEILLSVKAELETRLGRSIGELHALESSTQVVAGINYLIKAKADEIIFLVKVHKPLPHTQKPPFILDLKTDSINEQSPLEPF